MSEVNLFWQAKISFAVFVKKSMGDSYQKIDRHHPIRPSYLVSTLYEFFKDFMSGKK